MFKNKNGQKLTFFAIDGTTGLPKTGDAANITIYVSIDDAAPVGLAGHPVTEVDSLAAKGDYVIAVTLTECDGYKLRFTGKSSTSNVWIFPQTIYTIPSTFAQSPGTTGGLLICGTNSDFTVTNQVLFNDGFAVSCSTTNRSAFTLAGNGTGVGLRSTGGATGRGVEFIGGATSGDAFYCSTTAGHGFHVIAAGADKYGIYSHCGITGNAMVLECNPNGSAATLVDRGHAFAAFSSDTTNGNAILLRSLFHGCGIFAKASDNEAAFHLQGGTTGPALRLWPGTGGLGTAAGLEVVGGPNGSAVYAVGGYTTNGGTNSTACSGVAIINNSTISGSVGLSVSSAMGSALDITASGSGSRAVNIYSLYSHAVNIDTNGASSHGVNISGGNSGTSDGIRVNAGTGGVGMRLGSLTVTGTSTLTGAVSLGSTLGVTGTTTLAALSITGTASVGSTFTITGGLVSNITGDITGNLSGKVQGSIVAGTVTTGATTTSIPTSSLSPAATVADQFKGRVVIFDKTTATAALRGQATDITASTSGGVLTVTALTTAPAASDTFVIV